MIKVYCDKCGNEIVPATFLWRNWRELHVVTGSETYPLDLCERCQEDMWKWMKGEDNVHWHE